MSFAIKKWLKKLFYLDNQNNFKGDVTNKTFAFINDQAFSLIEHVCTVQPYGILFWHQLLT